MSQLLEKVQVRRTHYILEIQKCNYYLPQSHVLQSCSYYNVEMDLEMKYIQFFFLKMNVNRVEKRQQSVKATGELSLWSRPSRTIHSNIQAFMQDILTELYRQKTKKQNTFSLFKLESSKFCDIFNFLATASGKILSKL